MCLQIARDVPPALDKLRSVLSTSRIARRSPPVRASSRISIASGRTPSAIGLSKRPALPGVNSRRSSVTVRPVRDVSHRLRCKPMPNCKWLKPCDHRHAETASLLPPAQRLARVHASHAPGATVTWLLRDDEEFKPEK